MMPGNSNTIEPDDREMVTTENLTTSRLNISGEFDTEEFFEFAALYARRLDLTGEFHRSSGGIEITVRGQPDLIDMFEVAMWLGPRYSHVGEIVAHSKIGDNRLFGGFNRH